MRKDFAALILTHKRPHKQLTVKSLRDNGYTGDIFFVVDNEDPTREELESLYPGQVVVFDKQAARAITDDADNTGKGLGVVYARNMCHQIARDLGLQYFIELDDDYNGWMLRFNSRLEYGYWRAPLDDVFEAMIDWLATDERILSVALSQGGDHIGGSSNTLIDRGPSARRKVMNSFICNVDRPFKFYGRINEDATAYVTLGRKGALFFTPFQAQLNQLITQTNPGGLTEIYLDAGTYVKSFYSVMWEPSCVKISAMGSPTKNNEAMWRIHHSVQWRYAVPKLLSGRYRKPDDAT